jgi:hypothetical protein
MIRPRASPAAPISAMQTAPSSNALRKRASLSRASSLARRLSARTSSFKRHEKTAAIEAASTKAPWIAARPQASPPWL